MRFFSRLVMKSYDLQPIDGATIRFFSSLIDRAFSPLSCIPPPSFHPSLGMEFRIRHPPERDGTSYNCFLLKKTIASRKSASVRPKLACVEDHEK